MSMLGVKFSARDELRAKILELEARLEGEVLTWGQRQSIEYVLKDYLVEMKNVEIELMRIPW